MGRNKKAKKGGSKSLIESTPPDSDEEQEEQEQQQQDSNNAASATATNDDDGKKKSSDKKPLPKSILKNGSGGGGNKNNSSSSKKIDACDGSGEDDSDGEPAASAKPAVKYPLRVEYCPACSFPVDLCEFSGVFETKCKPLLMERLRLQGDDVGDLEDMGEKGRKRKEKSDTLPGGKKKNQGDPDVVITVKQRVGRKHITTVQGLDQFGHDLEKIAKELKKQFSCGGGVTSAPGQLDSVEIQGDIKEALIELLPKKYSIPRNRLFAMEKGGKVPL